MTSPLKPAAAGAILALLFGGCHRPQAPEAAPGPHVNGDQVVFAPEAPQLGYLEVAPVQARQAAIDHLTGRMVWDDDFTVRIFSPVAGQVTRLLARVGQSVTAGQVLAELDSPDYGQARADALTGAANRAAADKALRRARDLYAHGAIAEKDVEAAEAAFIAADAEAQRAAGRLALYGGAGTVSGESYGLRSPVAGMVVERNLAPGQEVRADQMLANATNLYAPFFVVTDPTRLWVMVDVAETDLGTLHPGQPLRVASAAYPDRAFDGSIEQIAPALDPATRTVQVRGLVRNPDRLLRAEMYVRVDVLTPDPHSSPVLQIPGRAIFMVEDRSYLFVELAPGRFERREVRIGTERDGLVPVFAGLQAGDKVVVEGGLLLESILEPSNG